MDLYRFLMASVVPQMPVRPVRLPPPDRIARAWEASNEPPPSSARVFIEDGPEAA